MGDHLRQTVRGKTAEGWKNWSAGKVLRDSLFAQITPMLTMSNCIADSRMRLEIQARCLDLVTAVEDIIERYELDDFPASVEM